MPTADSPRPTRLTWHWSVRARTTLLASVAVAIALIISSLVLTSVFRQSLLDDLDTAARARVNDVAGLVQQRGPVPRSFGLDGHEDGFVQVVQDGEVIGSTRNLAGEAPISRTRPPVGRVERFTVQPVPTGEDDRYRVVSTAVERPGAGEAVIYVGFTIERMEDGVGRLRDVLVVGIPLLVLFVAITTWYLVGRALRPVEALRLEVADISARDLSRRVPVPATRDEIARLAGTMNETLDRLEESVERQRRFVGDASHELQSPIAAAQVELGVALAHREHADWPAVADALLREHERLERLIRDLLYLARSEQGEIPIHRAPIDIDDLIHDAAVRLRPRSPVPIDESGVHATEIRGDADQLRRAIGNLLENGCRYARSRVTITTSLRPGQLDIVVANDGPPVPEADRERIFERFARSDGSRTRGTGGTGLGLAISKEIVVAHGGDVALTDQSSGAAFVITLPRPSS
jgi:signal transduction histidine kinase